MDRAGEILIRDVPGHHELERMTKQVFANNNSPTERDDDHDRDGDRHDGAENPIPMNVGQGSPIKQVF